MSSKEKPKKWRFKLEDVLESIDGSAGIKTEICQRLGCSRPTFDKYLEERPQVLEAYNNECRVVGDMARVSLYSAIESGESWAVMFYLDRKDPEYARQTTKMELSGGIRADGIKEVKIVHVKPKS